MIKIEFEDPGEPRVCSCCGQTTRRYTRFVTDDEGALAIYYAQFVEGHEIDELDMVISLGEWGGWEGDEIPWERRAFAMKWRRVRGKLEIMIVDAETCPWFDVDIIGRKLTRQEALADPEIKEVFHITDHISFEDRVLMQLL